MTFRLRFYDDIPSDLKHTKSLRLHHKYYTKIPYNKESRPYINKGNCMHQTLFKLSASIIAVSLLAFAALSNAQNINAEQEAAYQARETYNENKNKLNALSNSVAQQEVRVAEAQGKLDDLKAQQTAAQTALAASKIDLDAKVEALNAVWDLRDK